MSGTGSTQLAALKKGRNGYGTELSEYFAKIANDRLEEYLHPKQKSLFIKEENNVKFKILNCDVREITDHDFPSIDYIITSPPYWDMLNMKGAENQAKRKEKGLKLNYSDNTKDLGNIEDYNNFLNELTDIYLNLIELLKPGGYITIIVKNIKKKGKNYPFAWDLTRKVSSKLIVLPEFFWLQDDINLAPYGYGNTFVSNTFHQYCLNFVKPIK
jgi:DNA modification methylase